MQPIGGWTRITRNDAPDLSAAVQYDNGTGYTDLTTEANNATVADVPITPATPAIGDRFYVGMPYPFAGLSFYLSTIAASGAGIWEYYNGTTETWVDLSATDNTDDFHPSGGAGKSYAVSWDVPAGWEASTVNSQGPFYYIRYRVTTAHDTQPVADFVDMGSSPIYQVAANEVPRGVAGWKDNGQNAWAGFGTHPGGLHHRRRGRHLYGG
jgi:hypothetical protein